MALYERPSTTRIAILRREISEYKARQTTLLLEINEFPEKDKNLEQIKTELAQLWLELSSNVYQQLISAMALRHIGVDIPIHVKSALENYTAPNPTDPFRDQNNRALQAAFQILKRYDASAQKELEIPLILQAKNELDTLQPRCEKGWKGVERTLSVYRERHQDNLNELAALPAELAKKEAELAKLLDNSRKQRLKNWGEDTFYWLKRNKLFFSALLLLSLTLSVLFPWSLAATIPMLVMVATTIQAFPKIRDWIEKHGKKLALLLLTFTGAIFLPLIPAISAGLAFLPTVLAIKAAYLSQITLGSTVLILSPLLLIMALPCTIWSLVKMGQALFKKSPSSKNFVFPAQTEVELAMPAAPKAERTPHVSPSLVQLSIPTAAAPSERIAPPSQQTWMQLSPALARVSSTVFSRTAVPPPLSLPPTSPISPTSPTVIALSP